MLYHAPQPWTSSTGQAVDSRRGHGAVRRERQVACCPVHTAAPIIRRNARPALTWARLHHATGSAMLRSMRQATKSWASRAVIIVLALSFGAWGINDVFTGGSRSAVATVGEVDVPTVLFDRQFQRALQRERERSGRPDLTRDEAHQAGLTGQVLNLLVREYLLDAEAARLGLRAADASVMRELQSSPAFGNEQGRFDPELYDLVLERNNMTRAEYEDLIRIDLLRDQILSAVGGDRKVPESLIAAVHRYRAEERSAQLALIPARGLAGLAEPERGRRPSLLRGEHGILHGARAAQRGARAAHRRRHGLGDRAERRGCLCRIRGADRRVRDAGAARGHPDQRPGRGADPGRRPEAQGRRELRHRRRRPRKARGERSCPSPISRPTARSRPRARRSSASPKARSASRSRPPSAGISSRWRRWSSRGA